MKFILTLLFSVSIITATYADDIKTKSEANTNVAILVKGKVTDSNTGETLVGVQVKLAETDLKTFTDFDGNFEFEEVKPGEYSIVASYISYKEHKIEHKNIDLFTENFNVELEPLQ